MTMDTPQGWIKLHYRLLEWEWVDHPATLALFIHLLLRVNHTPLTWKGMEIPRGSMVTSLQQLCFFTGLSVQQARTALKHLEATGEITNKVTNKCRLITVCKYESYQSAKTSANKVGNKLATDNQQAINNQTHNQLTLTIEYKNKYIVVDDDACVRTREEVIENFFRPERRAAVEQLCMSLGVTIEELRTLADQTLAEWEATDVPPHTDRQDAYRHMLSQIRRKLQATRLSAARPAAKNPRPRPAAPRNVSHQWDQIVIPAK